MDSPADPPRDDSITYWLNEARTGSSAASEQLWERVYDEVRRLAQQAVHRESAPISVQATEIAHEVYLKLATGQALAFENRSHLLVTVARAIRRLLVDHARSRNAFKRGGQSQRVPLDDVFVESEGQAPELIDLDAALGELE